MPRESTTTSHPGLSNLGNTCYFNSVIQALAATEPLRRSEDDDDDAQSGRHHGGTLDGQLDGLLETLATSTASSVNPSALFRAIAHRARFSDNSQEDAHELFSALLNEVRTEQVAARERAARQEAGVDENDVGAVQAWTRRRRRSEQEARRRAGRESGLSALDDARPFPPKPKVDAIFSGKLASIVVCDVCKTVKVSHDDFLDLSLPIKPEEGREAAAAGASSSSTARRRGERRERFKLAFGAGKGDLSRGISLQRKTRKMVPAEEANGYHSEADATKYKQVDLPDWSPTPVASPPRPANDLSSMVDQTLQLQRQDSRRKSLDSARDAVATSKAKHKEDAVIEYTKRRSRLGFGHWTLKKAGSGSATDKTLSHHLSLPLIIEPAMASADMAVPREPEPISSATSGTSLASESAIASARAQALLAPIQMTAQDPTSPAISPSISPNNSLKSPPAPPHRKLSGDKTASSQTHTVSTALASAFGLGGGSASTRDDESTATTLYDCLVMFTAVESLQGDNAFACETCWKKEHPDQVREYRAKRSERRRERARQREARGTLGETLSSDEPVSESESDIEERPKSTAREDGRSNADRPERSEDEEVPTSAASSTTTSSDDLTKVESESQTGEDTPVARKVPVPELKRPTQVRVKSNRRSQLKSVLRPAQRRLLIGTPPPPVLVIQLKRFQQYYNANNSFFSSLTSSSAAEIGTKKIDDWIEFPEVLDLAPFMEPNIVISSTRSSAASDLSTNSTETAHHGRKSGGQAMERTGSRSRMSHWFGGHTKVGGPSSTANPESEHIIVQPNKACLYRLYAVVVHIGSIAGGHYVSYVLSHRHAAPKKTSSSSSASLGKPDPAANGGLPTSSSTSEDRQWVFCSDTTVRKATLAEVLRARAYLCFYEKTTRG